MASQNYFSVMVVGENPEELLKPYSKSLKVDEYIVYKKEDAKKIQDNEISVLKQLVSLNTLPRNQKTAIFKRLSAIELLDEDEYFDFITKNMKHNENGDAVSNENPNGKYDYIKLGRRFSMPLKTYDGQEVYQGYARDIAFEQMHLSNQETYEVIWEMFKEGKKPSNEIEKTLYDNMSTLNNYFDSFATKEDYVSYNTSFFHYAYLDNNGWIDMDDSKDPKEWVREFYQRFVSPLDPNDFISIYECRIL